MERRDADPGPLIERIQCESLRNKRPDHGRGKTPVSEKEVAPDLHHNPGTFRHRPLPMIHFTQRLHGNPATVFCEKAKDIDSRRSK